MAEGNGDRDDQGRLVLRLDGPPPQTAQGRRPRRSGQSLTEYLIVVATIASVGFGAVAGLRVVMDRTYGKVTAKLEGLEFVTAPPSAAPPSSPLGATGRGRALDVSSARCEHPRIVGGECQVCFRTM